MAGFDTSDEGEARLLAEVVRRVRHSHPTTDVAARRRVIEQIVALGALCSR